jgi:hypothetical protein
VTPITSIDTVRAAVLRHFSGIDYEQAIHAAAAELCLPPETVREAVFGEGETA